VVVDKKVNLELVGLDGNAFFLMCAFDKQAKKEGWTKEEIQKVIDECKKSDYDHLIQTLVEHCATPEEDEEDEFNDWDHMHPSEVEDEDSWYDDDPRYYE